ncbi:MAG: c-type cytochrome [Bacteroidota bacterium]
MGSSVFSKFSLLLIFGFYLSIGYAEDLANGESLYKANCSACHKVKGKLVGPQLAGVTEKYANDKEWLYAWVKNAQGMINAGDPKAVALYEQYNKQLMQAFPTLANSDIDDILAYVDAEAAPKEEEIPGGGEVAGSGSIIDDPEFYYALVGLVSVLALIALMLVFITATMVTAVRSKEQAEEFNWGEVWQRFTTMMRSPYVITTITTLVMVGGLSKTVTEAREIGLHQGYMPEQPIAFSHKLHAGQYEIDCKYCHSGTYKSKSAWIPSLNVCMNCHKYIAEGPSGEEEIAKIYEAVGWDVNEAAYTKEPKNVEWVRIHNIPDHAYFNHAQHVVVGGLECQTCHGPIQEMEVVYQYSNLGMGWCIECHRQEKVKVLGKETDMTVADMGGLNCARCHY